MNVARRLFLVLNERGTRYDWFATRLGISKSNLSHIKAGDTPFPRRLRARAAELLGVPESMLFDDDVTADDRQPVAS